MSETNDDGKPKRRRKTKRPPAPEPLALPGMDDVAPTGPPAYRVEVDAVPATHVDAVIAGRADLPSLTKKQFEALMRVYCALRIEAFDLPFDTFSGGTCAVVRKGLKTYKASEIARAIRGCGRDEWGRQRKPSLAAIIARVPEWMTLADDEAPTVRPRTIVIADYLRIHPYAIQIDWWRPWADVEDVEQHNTAVIEAWVDEMKALVAKSKLDELTKRRLIGARRR